MNTYRKRPLEIEAVQWQRLGEERSPGESLAAIKEWGAVVEPAGSWADGSINGYDLLVPTTEGMMLCKPGWWIIRGVEGEFYVCSPTVFEATYDAVATPMRESIAGVVRTGHRHELKSWPKQFTAIRSGLQTFDVRIDDGRNFAAGDEIEFAEWTLPQNTPLNTAGEFTGQTEQRIISYVYRSLHGNADMTHPVVVLGLAKEHGR